MLNITSSFVADRRDRCRQCVALTSVLLLSAALVATNDNLARAEATAFDPVGELIEKTKPLENSTDEPVPSESAPETVDTESAIGTRHKIPKEMWKRMNGKSWHRRLPCPPRKALTLLRIPHWNFSYERTEGQLIVAADAADDILQVFAQLYEDGFPIEQMKPVHLFNGNDPKSMAANNTSAFNCRLKTSKRGLSEHSYGKAIDINPIQNPYVSRGKTQPRAGRPFRKNRTRRRKGMIHPGSKVIRAFRKIGWHWGGNWRSVKDYQHFSKSGK